MIVTLTQHIVWFLQLNLAPSCERTTTLASGTNFSPDNAPGTEAGAMSQAPLQLVYLVTNLLVPIVDVGQQPSLQLLWLLSDFFLFSFTEPLARYMFSFIAKGAIFLYRSLALSRF